MRVFIDQAGMWYKADSPKSLSDMERPVVNKDFIDALPDDGSAMHLVDVDEKIRLAQGRQL